MVQKLLLKFHKTTGSLPHKLIFYRDGVSEGQFKEVLQYEVRCCLFALYTVIRDSVLDFSSRMLGRFYWLIFYSAFFLGCRALWSSGPCSQERVFENQFEI